MLTAFIKNFTIISHGKKADISFNTGALYKYWLKNWYWFLISLVFFIGMGLLYLKIKSPLYVVHSSIMFNQDEDNDGGNGGLLGSLMSSFSIGNSLGVNLDDEMYKLKSHTALCDLARTLDLNRNYYSKPGLFKRKIWYYGNSPVVVDVPADVLDTLGQATSFKITIPEGGKNVHIKVKQGIYKTVYDATVPTLPVNIKTPLATFTVRTTEYYNHTRDLNFVANVCSPEVYASDFVEHLGVSMPSKKANAVEVQVEDVNTTRGKDIVNTLIDLYNNKSINDRKVKNQATLDFLNQRLLKLYEDIDVSETGIADYKQRNNLVTPEYEAQYMLRMKQVADGQMVELETQQGILKMLRDFLSSPDNKFSLVPLSGLSTQNSEGLNSAINTYNNDVLELLKLKSSAKGNNANVRQLESQIEAMHRNLITTLDRSISANAISLKRMSSENGGLDSRISTLPKLEQQLTNLYRDQEIKNRIYGYLLQKKEETEMQLVRVLPPGLIIDKAYVDLEPESPKKTVVIALCFFMGIMLPLIVLYFVCRHKIVNVDKEELAKEERKFKEEVG